MKFNFTKLIRVATVAFLAMFATLNLQAQFVEITAPASVAGQYQAKPAWFQQEVTAVSGDIYYQADTLGCNPINEDLSGRIAMIDRGACAFTTKAINAQTAGAIAVIVCNNDTANPNQINSMGGDDMGALTINTVMLSFNQCDTIKTGLGSGLSGGMIAPTANQTCLTATAVTPGTYTVDSLTGGGGRNLFEFPDENYAAAWYTFTPAMDGLMRVNSCMGGADTRLAVGTGHCELSTISVLAANDDFCDLGNGNAWASQVELLVTGGTEYYIYWDDHWSASGFDWELVLDPVPMVDVTVTVDMNAEATDNGGYILGSFNGWSSTPMTDNMDGTYSYVISGVTAGQTVEYLFQNGLNIDQEVFPPFQDICTVSTPDSMFTNRFFVPGIENSTIGTVCFNSCDVCPVLGCNDPMIDDNIDSYTLGSVAGQAGADHWGDWLGAPPATVSDDQSLSGANSILIDNSNSQDVLLLLGDQSTGKWVLKWDMYIPAGATGYYNIQDDEDVSTGNWNLDVQFNETGGTPGEGSIDQTGTTFTYPEDAWFTVVQHFDLDGGLMQLYINGAMIEQDFDYTGLMIGAVNFYSVSTNNTYYLDNVIFKQLPADSAPLVCPDGSLICDNLEAYSLGDPAPQSPHFGPWNADFNGGEISTDFSVTDCQSLKIDGTPGDVDNLLLLGDRTSGQYALSWKQYVPAGNAGYHNIQKVQDSPGAEFGNQVFFLADGTGEVDSDGDAAFTFTYTQDAWIDIHYFIDVDNDNVVLTIEGTEVYSNPLSHQAFGNGGAVQFGAINFFPIDATYIYYIDDIQFVAYPADNSCAGATDINSSLGGDVGTVVSSGPYDNTNYISSGDPDFGWECFGEPDGGGAAPSLERTRWFTFTGDGGEYFIEAVGCGDDPIDFNDTQFAIYSGDNCGDLTAVLCSEDGPNAASGSFPAGDTLATEFGTTYYIMVDGFGPDFPADGEFCLEFTATDAGATPVDVTFNVNMANETVAADGAFIAGEFNGWTGEAMTDNSDGTWSFTAQLIPGDTVEYKFQNGEGGWEDNFPEDDCGLNNNRFVVVGDMDMNTDLVCFNECTDCAVSAEDIVFQNSIKVFPNPARDLTNISFDFAESNNVTVELVNKLGQRISFAELNGIQNATHELSVNNLAAGMYFIHISNGEASMVEKLFVE